VQTSARAGAQALIPLPQAEDGAMEALLTDRLAEAAAQPQPVRRPPVPPAPRADLEEALALPRVLPEVTPAAPPAPPPLAEAPRPAPPPSPPPPAGDGATTEDIIREIALAEGATYRPAATLFRDFAIRCRQRGIPSAHVDLPRFRRMFAFAVSGLDAVPENLRETIAAAAEGVEDDLLAPYLAILIAAHCGHAMPGEDELGRLYGSASPSRVRRLLEHLERQGRIVVREDFGGERSITVPALPAAA